MSEVPSSGSLSSQGDASDEKEDVLVGLVFGSGSLSEELE
jgi:hypothetical protein